MRIKNIAQKLHLKLIIGGYWESSDQSENRTFHMYCECYNFPIVDIILY